MFSNISFESPQYLWIMLVNVPMIVWYIWQRKRLSASLQVSGFKAFKGIPKTYKHYTRHALLLLRVLAICLLAVAFARPQSTDSWTNSKTYGIDIVMAVDVSSSMLAEDLKPNRLEASKNVAAEFIAGRRNDRMGLVVFSGESFTQCPLTTDHAVLLNLFKQVQSGLLEDGTAIGMGLVNSITRLKESDALSKVVILLTDGVNNQGEVDPVTAAEIAQTFGIRVYTIGVGTNGTAPYPVQTMWGVQYREMEVEIDEEVLKEISRLTGGRYFRATDNESLKSIYREIDKLEKSKIEDTQFSKKNEEFLFYALLAAVFLLLELVLKNTILRNIP